LAKFLSIPPWMKKCGRLLSSMGRKIGKAIGFREVNFYAGLVVAAMGGEVLLPGAGRLLAGGFLVYYAVWRLR